MSTEQLPRITVIQNSPDVPMDLFASRWGTNVRLVLAFAGENVPTLEEVGDGLVVLGGQMSAYDDAAAPWLPATRALLADAARSGVPTLGICLGAQLLAVGGGGAVQVAAPPGREAGVVTVRWRDGAATDPVLGPVRAQAPVGQFVSMHADAVVELPAGAVWLGASAMYPYQAFRLGSALGVQFHPEASVELALRWAEGHDDVDTAALVDELTPHAAEMAASGEALADAFLAQVRAHASRTS
ncbi:type 1 glutamine amidotransferase [Antribacter gilvus]|uniref:type 1 glutamine amidotransferase n=1 Tax=Antribacter gilvus TaxID=2304675 RepID=UPI001F0C0ED1|nr:type 1 glutamine amidotransferase [Antribacter gilvus]